MTRRIIGMVLLLIAGFTGPAYAERRVALVVGNSAYRNITPLDNPAYDASLIAETLKGLGFSLVGNGAQLDLDKNALDQAVQDFGRQIQGADVAMFYYAGHGVQLRGSNYLVPINANPTREADVDFQMLDVNVVMNQMQSSGTRLNLVILDACRNNPFGGRGLRSTQSGLAQMRAPEGTLISYATQPGNVALDGTDGHSPYTRALAETIRRAGLDLFETFNEVGLAVKRSTGGSQQPWVSSSPIEGKFYFAGLPGPQPELPARDRPAEAMLPLRIVNAEIPDVVSNGPHGDATVTYSGTPVLPVTAILRPRDPCVLPAPPGRVLCKTETRTFQELPADGRLVMKDVAWCTNYRRGRWTLLYEILLLDGAGRQSAPVPTPFGCIGR